ncbi:DUF2637 domain-containing protein [Streptomyces sp. 6N106]|uniref:DUF2637 domain-containing protein n=1 Tax=Streptomyces sp. 6N106 TaxID=3457418 RepID=UPI003FD67438
MNTHKAERVALYITAGVIIVLTAGAFWLSYAHLADVAAQYGLAGSDSRRWAWPGTIDLFIMAGEVMMFRAALRKRVDPWAIVLTVVGSGGSIALNVAGVGPGQPALTYVVAAVPPSAALLAFGALMRQVHSMVTEDTKADTVADTMDMPLATLPTLTEVAQDAEYAVATRDRAHAERMATVSGQADTPAISDHQPAERRRGLAGQVATTADMATPSELPADIEIPAGHSLVMNDGVPVATTADTQTDMATEADTTPARGRTVADIKAAVAYLEDTGQPVNGTTYAEHVGVSARTGRRDLVKVGISG